MTGRFSGLRLPLAGIKSPKLLWVYDYWHACRGDFEMPARSNLQPEQMRPVLGNVMLVDVIDDPLDLRYSLFGSNIAASHGHDYTGQSVRDLMPAQFAEVIWAQYTEVIEAQHPLVHRIIFENDFRSSNYERITLPLSADGERVDKLLAVSEFESRFWQSVDMGAQQNCA